MRLLQNIYLINCSCLYHTKSSNCFISYKKYNIEYEIKASDNSGQEIEVKIRQSLKEEVKEEFEGLGLNVMG